MLRSWAFSLEPFAGVIAPVKTWHPSLTHFISIHWLCVLCTNRCGATHANALTTLRYRR